MILPCGILMAPGPGPPGERFGPPNAIGPKTRLPGQGVVHVPTVGLEGEVGREMAQGERTVGGFDLGHGAERHEASLWCSRLVAGCLSGGAAPSGTNAVMR